MIGKQVIAVLVLLVGGSLIIATAALVLAKVNDSQASIAAISSALTSATTPAMVGAFVVLGAILPPIYVIARVSLLMISRRQSR